MECADGTKVLQRSKFNHPKTPDSMILMGPLQLTIFYDSMMFFLYMFVLGSCFLIHTLIDGCINKLGHSISIVHVGFSSRDFWLNFFLPIV